MLSHVSCALAVLALLGVGSVVRGACPAQSNVKLVTYSTPGTKLPGSLLQNPERGFYYNTESKSSAPSPLNLPELQGQKTQTGATLIFRYYILNSFLTSNISSSFLTSIANDFSVLRQAGMKGVIRFCYTVTDGDDRDAALSQLLSHIAQLKSILQNNADVILVVQAGFIGTWGEWYYSRNYSIKQSDGSYNPLGATQWNSRVKIVSALLDAVPASRMVQLRTPTYWQKYCNTTSALPLSSAFSGVGCARLGVHNDCFLAPDQDMGTFDTSTQRTWLTAQAKYVMTGGETCALNGATTQCSGAMSQIAAQRFTYLNNGYHEQVISGWKTGGCYNTIEGMLGYRYQLHNGTFPSSVSRGSAYCATIYVANTGVAPVYNQRKVQVVLRNQVDKSTTFLNQNAVDPRRWAPDSVTAVDLSFSVPSTLAAGTYDVLLNLADAASTLAVPAYRILVANTNVQEKTTRFNLLTTVSVV